MWTICRHHPKSYFWMPSQGWPNILGFHALPTMCTKQVPWPARTFLPQNRADCALQHAVHHCVSTFASGSGTHVHVDIFKHVYLHKNKVWAKDLMAHCFGIPVRSNEVARLAWHWQAWTSCSIASVASRYVCGPLGPNLKKWLQMQMPVRQDISTSVTMGLVPTTGSNSWSGQTIKSTHQVVPLKDGRGQSERGPEQLPWSPKWQNFGVLALSLCAPLSLGSCMMWLWKWFQPCVSNLWLGSARQELANQLAPRPCCLLNLDSRLMKPVDLISFLRLSRPSTWTSSRLSLWPNSSRACLTMPCWKRWTHPFWKPSSILLHLGCTFWMCIQASFGSHRTLSSFTYEYTLACESFFCVLHFRRKKMQPYGRVTLLLSLIKEPGVLHATTRITHKWMRASWRRPWRMASPWFPTGTSLTWLVRPLQALKTQKPWMRSWPGRISLFWRIPLCIGDPHAQTKEMWTSSPGLPMSRGIYWQKSRRSPSRSTKGTLTVIAFPQGSMRTLSGRGEDIPRTITIRRQSISLWCRSVYNLSTSLSLAVDRNEGMKVKVKQEKAGQVFKALKRLPPTVIDLSSPSPVKHPRPSCAGPPNP